MKRPRLFLSNAAVADILEQADWYRAQSGDVLEARWEKAVTSTLLRIVNNASAGAPCSFQREDLRHVRRTAIPGFSKHLLFYKFDTTELFVLRVIHGARDLESFL